MCTLLLHQSCIVRAQKIHGEILKIHDETVESIDKLKNESAADRLYLLREANIYADDLNHVVCSLAQVTFKIDKSKHVHRDLQHIINILCSLATGIHKSLQYDHESVKTELKNNIKAATHVAERLLTIIRSDDIHELKQELLNNQADVLFAVDRVRLTNLIKSLNQQQMEDLVHKPVDTIKAVLLSLDSKDSNIQQKIVQSTNHVLCKHQGVVNHILRAVTSNHFNDEIKTLFLDIASVVNRYVADMHQLFLKDSQLDQLIEDCHKTIVDGVGILVKLTSLLGTEENTKVSDCGAELVLYIFTYVISCIFMFLRSLQYAKSDN